MGMGDLNKLISGDTTQQPVKQDEPVGAVGGAGSDQSMEKKQEDYDKGNVLWLQDKTIKYLTSELEEMLNMKKKKAKKKKPIDLTQVIVGVWIIWASSGSCELL